MRKFVGSIIMLILVMLIYMTYVEAILFDSEIMIEDTYNDSFVTINVDQQYVIEPFESCVTVSWNLDGIAGVYLKHTGGLIGWGQRDICRNLSDLSFEVHFLDETIKTYNLPIQVIDDALLHLVIIIVIGGLSIILFMNKKFDQRISEKYQKQALTFFIVICSLMMLIGMGDRVNIAFSTNSALVHDETYYASIASTGASGLGLYPYIQGYSQMPVMGGIGGTANLYVLAYLVFGPSLWGLRLVSITASFVGLAGISVLTRRWYGTSTALIILAILPHMYLFVITNSIRMDSITFAYLSWALVFFSFAWERKKQLRWQVMTGIIFAMGLHAHIHTFGTAFAVGLLYLVSSVMNTHRAGDYRLIFKTPFVGYVVGYLIGFALFALVMVFPNPDAFIRTAGLARLRHTGIEEQSGMSDPFIVLSTFLSPDLIIGKELRRYATLSDILPTLELILWGLAVLVLFVTARHVSSSKVRILFIGIMIGNTIILNNPHPIYITHSLPLLLILPLAHIINFGLRRLQNVETKSFSTLFLLVSLFLGIIATRLNSDTATIPEIPSKIVKLTPLVKEIASTECIIAGNPAVYIPHFLEYPYFVGTRETEFGLGSRFYGLSDQPIEYWKQKQPDLIFGELVYGLSAYVRDMNYIRIRPDIWVKPDNLSDGCQLMYD